MPATLKTSGEIRTIDYRNGRLYLIDQTKLPHEFKINTYSDYESIAKAIEIMIVRGAPAIGVTAACGIAIGMRKVRVSLPSKLEEKFNLICDRFARTRPTAVNLFWGISQMKKAFAQIQSKPKSIICDQLEQEAIKILNEDIKACKKIGEFGSALIYSNSHILTHCNAGALATVAYGTALSVFRFAHWKGIPFKVIASETRPRLQGASLTAWEMVKEKIPCQVVSDNMVGFMMSRGLIDCVITGADRIAANGDTANKIGTYSVAILAKEHNIPFYIAAPLSTFDFNIKNGDAIEIEIRNSQELTHIQGKQIYPNGVELENPAFDVTPVKYIHGFITEKGIVKSPEELGKLIKRQF